MIERLNKKSQSGLAAAIISLVVLASSALLVTNGTINGSAVSDMQFENFIEKAIDIEVWANTTISIEEDLRTKLVLDNGSALQDKDIEFQINDLNSSMIKEKTDSEGYVKPIFNLYTINPGNYSLTVVFQGSSALYLNPSSLKAKIQIIEENETRLMKLIEIEGNELIPLQLNETNLKLELNLTNQTLVNITNFTFEGLCKEFTEQVLWSSGYSNDLEGSTNYQTWYPKYNCTEIGEDCFLGTLEVQTRFLYFGENNEQGEGYIQISNSDESICGNPEQGNYSRYLAYEILHGESKKSEQSCGNNKNLDAKCGIDLTDGFEDPLACYGIKAYADSQFIVDVFEVTYKLCYEKGGENA